MKTYNNEYEREAKSINHIFYIISNHIPGKNNNYNFYMLIEWAKHSLELMSKACVSSLYYNNEKLPEDCKENYNKTDDQYHMTNIINNKMGSWFCMYDNGEEIDSDNLYEMISDYKCAHYMLQQKLISIENSKVKKIMKKWWIEKELDNGIVFSGWVNTMHECCVDDLPKDIYGSFWCEFYDEGLAGHFQLDDKCKFKCSGTCVFGKLSNKNDIYDKVGAHERFDGRLEDCHVSSKDSYIYM